jgi:hypothetical protein
VTRRRRARGSGAGPSVAAAIAIAMVSVADAQTGLRIDTIQPVGDWDRVAVAGTTLFVTASPNTRLARAYCLSSYLKVPYDEIPNLGPAAGAEAEKTGASWNYACLRLACARQGPRAIEVGLAANAAPNPGETGMPLGVSLRLRFTAAEPLTVLFQHAHAGQTSRDGALEMLDWRVGEPRAGAGGPQVPVSIAFAAPLSFVEQLAAKLAVAFHLSSGQDREIAALKHGARVMEFSLAGAGDVLAGLRRDCARPSSN